jgi:flagellar biosynthetic protein FliO
VNTYIPVIALVSDLNLAGGEGGLTGAPDLFSSPVRMVSALAITLGILFLIFYLLRWYFSKKSGSLGSRGLIRVISTTYLGSKRSLLLADIAGEKLLLGLSPQAISLLAKIDSQEGLEKVAAAERGAQTETPFLWYLERFMAKPFRKRETTGVKE